MTEGLRVTVTASVCAEFRDDEHAEAAGTSLVNAIEEWDTGDLWDVDYDVESLQPFFTPPAATSHGIANAAIDKLDRVRDAVRELKKMAPHPTGRPGENATFFAWAKVVEALQEEI